MTFKEIKKEEGHIYDLTGYWEGEVPVDYLEEFDLGINGVNISALFNLKAIRYRDEYKGNYEYVSDISDIENIVVISDGKEQVIEKNSELWNKLEERCYGSIIEFLIDNLSNNDFKS